MVPEKTWKVCENVGIRAFACVSMQLTFDIAKCHGKSKFDDVIECSITPTLIGQHFCRKPKRGELKIRSRRRMFELSISQSYRLSTACLYVSTFVIVLMSTILFLNYQE